MRDEQCRVVLYAKGGKQNVPRWEKLHRNIQQIIEKGAYIYRKNNQKDVDLGVMYAEEDAQECMQAEDESIPFLYDTGNSMKKHMIVNASLFIEYEEVQGQFCTGLGGKVSDIYFTA